MWYFRGKFLCYYTLVFLLGTSCGGGGGVYIASLACDSGMDRANGDEIPAPSNAIDVCASKHQSALIGGDGDFVSIRRAKGPRIGPQQMSESRCLRKQTTSSERKAKAVVRFSERRPSRDLRMAGGARFRSEERSNIVRKRAMADPTSP